ncbi:MAG: hypothetical protein GC159_12490 [Phycisphaera sp.]|nr:hypothetical protein [Phycisphaera sp.]
MRYLSYILCAAMLALSLALTGCAAEGRASPFDGLTAEQHRVLGQFTLEQLSHGRGGASYGRPPLANSGITGAELADRTRRYAESMPRQQTQPTDDADEPYVLVDASD